MSPSRRANRLRMRPWPVWLFVAIALLLNISMPVLIERDNCIDAPWLLK